MVLITSHKILSSGLILFKYELSLEFTSLFEMCSSPFYPCSLVPYLNAIWVVIQKQDSQAGHFLGLYHCLQISQKIHMFWHICCQHLFITHHHKYKNYFSVFLSLFSRILERRDKSHLRNKVPVLKKEKLTYIFRGWGSFVMSAGIYSCIQTHQS